MSNFTLKATHKPVKDYYETLEKFGRGKFDNEGNIRGAFEALLVKCARAYEWMVVPEYQIPRSGKSPLRVDAAVLDAFNLPRGYWEAKDEKDDLRAEMNKKFALGYPRTNILFQKPTHAILFQDGRIAFDGPITDAEKLVEVLRYFFEWRQPHQEDWDRAVQEFSDRIPEIAKGAMALIAGERKSNPAFVARFTAFAELCRESINPDLKDEAVEEMLVQHLLTERIFRRIFDNPEFTRRNVIAAEIEKVIDSLTKKHFSRDSFLRDLDPFYKAIEETAATASDYAEKQAFLNSVYERFFQGFSKKQADTHGIVYTPQPIVDFMVRSVEEILKTEFGRSLSDKGVHILDPFVGTGNFITRAMKEIRTSSLPHKYKEELHCNEIMLLPYYIASMNIEHAYLDRVGEYEPFEGICLVDTFELAEPRQAGFEFMTETNSARVKRQKKDPIFVIVGNPPYNSWQDEEDDNAKNRKYPTLDQRMLKTYSKDSSAVNKNSLWDPYIKAIRWASDRIGNDGVVALVTKNSFAEGRVTEGVRKHLLKDFDLLYVLNLGGDVRDNPSLSGTTHNVFGIQVGVSVNFFVRKAQQGSEHTVRSFETDEYWTRLQKLGLLEKSSISTLPWKEVPRSAEDWIGIERDPGFRVFVGIDSIFEMHSNGLKSNRDQWVYDSHVDLLESRIRKTIEFYNEELSKWNRSDQKQSIDSFVQYDETRISWSRDLKLDLKRGHRLDFSREKIRSAIYRPYFKTSVYFDRILNEEVYSIPKIFPYPEDEFSNASIVATIDKQIDFSALAVSCIPCVHLGGRPSQVFPFYTYDEDGTNRRENITDWALGEFRKHYGQQSISKWDIFHYTYGLLHHPEYRTRYAANLKRELSRIPMAADFARYAEIGAALMKLHIEYEQQAEYPLERTETGKLDWRVEKMALSKDKTQLKYNGFLTLSGIPPETYEYRLGNRSALEWVVDQYRVSTDARSGIVNDPNREDDQEYIVRLVGQVVTVSVETVRLVKELAGLSIDQV
ncbi:MAG: type ISP restriction/modification enzyme [Terracidiphilus sp.]